MKYDEILSNEDIKFLKELAYELKSQDTLLTAKPVFYQIYEKEKIGPVEWGYEDGIDYCIGELCEPIIAKDISDAKTILEDDYEISKSILNKAKDFDDIEEICKEHGIDFTAVPYKLNNKFTNAFLTQKAYQRHVDANYYHYNNPHFYVKHGWRNPELKRLLEIVEKFDGDDE